MTQRSRRHTLLASILASLACGAVFAGAAQAVPAWYFEGEELVGKETIRVSGVKSSMSVFGFATKCEDFDLVLTISNVSGTGQGSVMETPISNCTTNDPACSVEAIEAENLPWAVNLTTVSSVPYVVIKGIRINVIYTGIECVLDETLVAFTGTAGGSYTNAIEILTFSPLTFKTTGTKLSALGSQVDWNAVFTTEALGFHNGEELTIK